MRRYRGSLGPARSARLAALGSVVASLTVACAEPTASDPPVFDGRVYALTHVEGLPLPAYRGQLGDDSLWQAAEEVEFHALNVSTYSGSFANSSAPGALPLLTQSGILLYAVEGDSIRFSAFSPCGATMCETVVRRGTISASTMVLLIEDTLEMRFTRFPAAP